MYDGILKINDESDLVFYKLKYGSELPIRDLPLKDNTEFDIMGFFYNLQLLADIEIKFVVNTNSFIVQLLVIIDDEALEKILPGRLIQACRRNEGEPRFWAVYEHYVKHIPDELINNFVALCDNDAIVSTDPKTVYDEYDKQMNKYPNGAHCIFIASKEYLEEINAGVYIRDMI